MATPAVDVLFQAYGEAWAARDIERIVSFFTDDAVYEDVAMGVVNRGKDEIRGFLAELFGAIPDFTVTPASAFSSGDWAGSEWTMTGTHTGDFPGLPATNKGFEVRGSSVLVLRDGRISRVSDYWDQVVFLRQIGVLPPA
jgi:steroid delta-isomerase-like uncharacterized protein